MNRFKRPRGSEDDPNDEPMQASQALVPGSYNPVYPYNIQGPFLMPPFYDYRDFKEERRLVLSLRDGSGGGGTGGSGPFDPSTLVVTVPLYYGSSQGLPSLNLRYGSGLTVENDTLIVRQTYNRPLTETNNSVGLNVGAGLQIGANNDLELYLQTADPLAVSNTNQLSLKIGGGLAVDSVGSLAAYPSAPLSLNPNNELTLTYSTGLQLTGNSLALKLASPLTALTDGSAGLLLGNGLGVFDGALAVKLLNPITFQGDNRLALKVGTGLKVAADGTLAAALSSGLSTDAQNQIIIQTGLGLEKDNNGYLTVKIGPGLFYDESGAINVRTSEGTPIAPVKPLFLDTSGNLTLLMGRGLESESSTGRLEVKLGDSLYFDNNGAINVTGGGTGAPVGADPPLLVGSNGHVQLSIALGLETVSNALQVKLGNALYFDDTGAINAVTGTTLEANPPLNLIDEQLTLVMDSPIYTTPTNSLSLRYGDGLTLNTEGALSVASQNPVYITQDQKVGLNVGGGLETAADGSLSVKLGANMVYDSAGRITFNTNMPIMNTGNGIGLNYRAPLYLRNGSLGIDVGYGFVVINNELKLNTVAPLTVYSAGIAIKLTNPFKVQGDKLALDIGAGLSLSNTGQLQVNLGAGMEFNNGQVSNTPPILWTGPKATQNLKIGIVEADCFLVLQKNGPIINGMVQLTHLKGTVLPISECILKFTSDGRLDESASSLDKPWGWWHPQNTMPTEDDPPNVKLTDMMPSPIMYVPGNQSFSMSNIFNMSVTTAPVIFSAEYNTRTDTTHPYSIRLVWIQNKDYSYVNINYTTAYFSYYGDELLKTNKQS